MRRPLRTILTVLAGLLCSASCAGLAAVAHAASGAPPARIVRYHGVSLHVPARWPVFDLRAQPSTCVRFNRHAVYLGSPSSRQVCPSQPVGRTEAILIAPGATPAGAAGLGAGSIARIVDRARDVTITATWRSDPALVARILGIDRRSLADAKRVANRRPVAARAALTHRVARGRAMSDATTPPGGAATPGEIYTGKGFDTCSTPSTTTMNDWAASPYRAIGVYIGGANMACSQTNLTSDWVDTESGLGWHIIPIYVGLQAPGSSCSGCAKLTSAKAASDGQLDAEDAVAQAQGVGLGTGNPIYDDMEAYDEGGSDSTAVLAFLQAWTEELHTLGYLSGVYSSDDSGIHDLANAPPGYAEPDDIWFANWNGEANTEDSELSSTQWIDHTRLHQYSGGLNEKYGGATLNVDKDELDAATAAAGSGSEVTSNPSAPPVASGPPTTTGAPIAGQILSEAHARWTNEPTTYSYQWETCPSAGDSGGAGVASTCTAIAGATSRTLTLTTAEAGATIRVVETATNAAGPGAPSVSAPTSTVTSAPSSGYWLTSSAGNVLSSPGARWDGSPLGRHVDDVVGLAPTPSGRGYWIATRAGTVYAYGNAGRVVARGVTGPVRAVVAARRRGVWLLTSKGEVVNLGGAPFYGSPVHSHLRDESAVAMAPTPDGRGYWIVDADGVIHSYGDAAKLAAPRLAHPVIDAVAAPAGGLWVLTAGGDLDNLGGAPFFGSPVSSHVSVRSMTSLTPTADGAGYWLVDAAGRVFAYGDAATYAIPSHEGSIVAISGG